MLAGAAGDQVVEAHSGGGYLVAVIEDQGASPIFADEWGAGCARLHGVHSEPPSPVVRASGELPPSAGAVSLSDTYTLLHVSTNIYKYAMMFTLNYVPWR